MKTHRKYRRIVWTAALAAAVAVGAAGAASASPNCIQDVWKAHGNSQNLTCTANDVRIAQVTNICVPDSSQPSGKCCQADGCQPTCNTGSPVTFTADFKVELNAQARYDIGLYLGADGDLNGDGALTGQCTDNVITSIMEVPPSTWVNLDGDVCGDIDNTNTISTQHNPQIVSLTVPTTCVGDPVTHKLKLPNCTSWRQPGSNATCSEPFDAYPGSPSKCNCQPGFTIDINVETPTLAVTKTVTDPNPPSLPQPGGDFTFQVVATNTSGFTTLQLDRICDDTIGTIYDDGLLPGSCPAGVLPAGVTSLSLVSTDCSLPQTLLPGGKTEPYLSGSQYTCSFTANIIASDEAKVPDTVTIYAHDQNDDPVTATAFSATAIAQVQVTEIPPTAMVTKSFDSLPCAIVRYKVDVYNTDPYEMEHLTALSDNVFGNIATVHDNVLATTCGAASPGPGTLPHDIAVDGHYICTFDAKVCGGGTGTDNVKNTDTITATLTDEDEDLTITPTSNSVTVTVTGTTQP